MSRIERDLCAADGLPVDRACRIGLEAAIAQKFGVNAALIGKVDLFGHQSVQHRADLRLNLAGVNGKGGFGQGPGRDAHGGEQWQQDKAPQ